MRAVDTFGRVLGKKKDSKLDARICALSFPSRVAFFLLEVDRSVLPHLHARVSSPRGTWKQLVQRVPRALRVLPVGLSYHALH